MGVEMSGLIETLLNEYRSQSTLWITDENTLDTLSGTVASEVEVISNRFDVYQNAKVCGMTAHFSDFDFDALSMPTYSVVIYRVSKEKPIVHHIINNLANLCASGCKVFLIGEKQDGIKTYVDKAAKRFNCSKQIKKQGEWYLSELTISPQAKSTVPLDDKEYSKARPTLSIPEWTSEQKLYSKPGVFGWNKEDVGSRLLIESLDQLPLTTGLSVLDLGCGYGYLSIRVAHISYAGRLVATDNNAAAIQVTQTNCEQLATACHNDLSYDVVADDCGKSLDEQFDLIVCNPPFHQGFEVDKRLTEKFSEQARKRLKPDGVAVFVVNQFVGIEKIAAKHFATITQLIKRDGFKVLALKS